MIAAMRDQGLPAPDYSASSISQVVVRLSRFGLLIGSGDGPYVLTRLERSAEVSGACWEGLSVLDTTADKSIHDIARTTGKSLDALRPRLRELAADRLVVATAPLTSRNRSYLLST